MAKTQFLFCNFFLDLKFVDVPRSTAITVSLKKEGTGLGFSLEGGKDSPFGDRPMTIKKIFTGHYHYPCCCYLREGRGDQF